MRKGRTARKQGTAPWSRRRRRVILATCGVLLLLSPMVIWRFRLRAEVLEGYAALKKQGIPTTMAELAAWEPRAPDEAAADAAYDAVFRTYNYTHSGLSTASPDVESMPEMFATPFPSEIRGALENRVKGNDEMLLHLRDASRFTRYRTVRDFAAGPWRDLRSLENPFRVLYAEACLLAEDGQGDAAVDAVMTGIRVARACRTSPFNNAFNEAIECEKQIVSAIYPVATRAAISEKKLEEFLEFARDETWLEDLQHSIIGSRCYSLYPRNALNNAGDLMEVVFGSRDKHDLSVMRFADEVAALVEIPRQDWEAHLRSQGSFNWQFHFWWEDPPAKSIHPEAIAVLQHRHAHGAFPASLEALVPEFLDAIPRDSDGRNLLLQQDESSFSIYEAGPDGQDDDGQSERDVIRFKRSFSTGR